MTDWQIYIFVIASLFSNFIIGIWCYLAGMRAVERKIRELVFEEMAREEDEINAVFKDIFARLRNTTDATGKVPGSRLQ